MYRAEGHVTDFAKKRSFSTHHCSHIAFDLIALIKSSLELVISASERHT